jgi:CDP-diacylglycerol---serine O-phosphatidyltransferase
MSGALEKRPRRAAYVVPTLFTSANMLLGFVAILQAFQGAFEAEGGDFSVNPHFTIAAKALGIAVFFDGVDGWVARMTHTTSDFGRELDSLADVITFGIAPAVLAFVWGVLFVISPIQGFGSHVMRIGYVATFFYVLCGAVRLARFNVQTNPTPKNPGRPDRKYFVGMPIPAGAAFIAASVYMDASPVRSLGFSLVWLTTVCLVALLMVSRWRYPSFKQIVSSKPRSPLIVLVLGAVAIICFWSQPVLLILAVTYVLSGIALRIGGLLRRHRRSRPRAPVQERQVG